MPKLMLISNLDQYLVHKTRVEFLIIVLLIKIWSKKLLSKSYIIYRLTAKNSRL